MKEAAPSLDESLLEVSSPEEDRFSVEVMDVKMPLVDYESEDLGESYMSACEQPEPAEPAEQAEEPHKSHKSAFQRLPDEIILEILQLVDPNGFASLALLNSKWRSVAQQADLYALHLGNCPSFAMSHHPRGLPAPVNDEMLPELRKLFAREVKRNLFEAYLRPNKTMVRLISTTISSSSCPGGEGIQFSPSPRGHHILAYNSSRIYVLDVTGPDIEVKREFKILRRPAATCIKDDGTLLAVLLTEMQVDVYDLTQSPPKRTQSIMLDHSPRAIALSPCGSVLAAAYEGGIEVSALSPDASDPERRAVKCDAVDALAFSFDGTQILGTTLHSSQPTTVILTAPYYDASSHMGDESTSNMSALWTTSILFPNTSRDCSHAVFIQEGNEAEASWTFTYDRSFETFRAVRIGDLRNGTTYFTGPSPSASPESEVKLIPCTLPAASYRRELVSAGFRANEIWLYGVPEDLSAVPKNAANTNQDESAQSRPQQDDTQSARVPQWQILCDKLRNKFVGGYRIGELAGVTMVKWVAEFEKSLLKERLVVAAPGLWPGKMVTEEEGMDFEDGGRLTLLDFDYRVRDGKVKEMVIEVGSKEPETLEEEHRDLATEVAIVRRRTVALKRASRASVMYASTASRHLRLPGREEANDDSDDPLVPRRTIMTKPDHGVDDVDAELEEGETQSGAEEQEALDAPYAHASPRSGNTLRRAATAAAHSRLLHPENTRTSQYEYRRADGRREHPHESDADNWVPPPPPYQKEDPGDAPAFLRHALQTGASTVEDQAVAPPRRERHQSQPYATMPSNRQRDRGRSRWVTVRRHGDGDGQLPPLPPQPPVPSLQPVPDAFLEAAARPPPSGSHSHSHSHSPSRPRTSDSRRLDVENIYDVSPPESPTRANANADADVDADADDRTVNEHPTLTRPVVSEESPPDGPNANTPQARPRRPPALTLQTWPTEPRSQSAASHAPPAPPRQDQTSNIGSRRLSAGLNLSRLFSARRATGDFSQQSFNSSTTVHHMATPVAPLEDVQSASDQSGQTAASGCGALPAIERLEAAPRAGRANIITRNSTRAGTRRRGWPGQAKSRRMRSGIRHVGNRADAGLTDATTRGVFSSPSQPPPSGRRAALDGMRARLSIQEKGGRCLVM